jgi:NADH-quinone oxidoreductase subunit C
MDASSLIDLLRRAAPAASVEAGPATDMPTVYVDREHWLEVARALRDDPALQFVFLADASAVDLLPAVPRYEVVYHLARLSPPVARLRVKVRVPGDDARVVSMVGVWPVAGWLEREVFDLFGLTFDGHPDLRRILLPEDWEGHPLRKDYPVQVRKDAAHWSPLQMSPEEFAENVRASHDVAQRRAGGEPAGTGEGGPVRRG